jgi:hypothetical protein
MADLDETQLAKLAREMVMNIRNYQAIFADFGIDENDYQHIEKLEFYRAVREQFAVEWNSTLSTDERVRLQNLAYYEQLGPVLVRRAMKDDANLGAATDVAKVVMKAAGVGEPRPDKATAERFVITINLGADVVHIDKPVTIGAFDGEADSEATSKPAVIEFRPTGEGGGP